MSQMRCLTLALVLLAGGASAAEVPVSTAAQLTTAIAAAKAGDTIVLAAGTYKINANVSCAAVGPITVKAAAPLAAKIEFNAVEGFVVTGANWTFEGLDLRGTCANDSDCEHAFHVTGAATSFTLRGNRIYDFNAQLKANAANIGGTWMMPHKGLLEGNEVFDTRGRKTSNPVTKFNIDTGDDWVVRANIIHDAFKDGGDGVSYATFMKSGGKNGLYERNLVMCSRDTTGGTRIGLSFGGGGTAPEYCFPAFDAKKACSVEHDSGTMRNNIIANCTDVGVYLNRAKNTKLLHNTLIGTSGVDFRFDTTSGEAHGNVLAGKIRMRDGGTFTGPDNLQDVSTFAAMYIDPLKGDLRKKGDLSALIDKATAATVTNDYCLRTRTGTHDWGALEHSLGDCVTATPPLTGETPPSDAGIDASPPGDALPADDSAPPFDGDIVRDETGTTNTDAPTSDQGGCGCRTTKKASRDGVFFALGIAAVVFARRQLKLRRS